MDFIIRTIVRGGVGAFFFFSWILQLLWNGILVDQLALVAVKVTYWQAAALWFLVTILTAWTGIARRPKILIPDIRYRAFGDLGRSFGSIGRSIKREIRSHVGDWVREEPRRTNGLDDLGERIEAKIKRGLSNWVGTDEDIEWDDLGEKIEKRIKEKFRDWTDDGVP